MWSGNETIFTIPANRCSHSSKFVILWLRIGKLPWIWNGMFLFFFTIFPLSMPVTGSGVCSARERLSTHAHLHLTSILCIRYPRPTTSSTVFFPSLMFTTPTSIPPSSLILTATTSVQWDSEPASRAVYNSEPVYGNSNCWNNNLLDYHMITYSFVHAVLPQSPLIFWHVYYIVWSQWECFHFYDWLNHFVNLL